jgi:hypothetical protein
MLWFSLRSLCIALAAVSLWLGYEVNWIRKRQNFVAQQRTVEFFFEPASDGRGGIVQKRAPHFLGLFGERGAQLIIIHLGEKEVAIDLDGQRVASPTHPTIGMARRLFPEAEIVAFATDSGEQLPIYDRLLETRRRGTREP